MKKMGEGYIGMDLIGMWLIGMSTLALFAQESDACKVTAETLFQNVT